MSTLARNARTILLVDAALLLIGLLLTAFNMLLVGWSVYAVAHVGLLLGFTAIAAYYRSRMDAWAWVGYGVLMVGLLANLPQIATIWSFYYNEAPSGITMLLPADSLPIGLLAAWITWIGLAFYALAARGARALPRGVAWIFVIAAIVGLLADLQLIAPLWWVAAMLTVTFGVMAVGASIPSPEEVEGRVYVSLPESPA